MTILLVSAQTFFADLCFFLLLCLTALYWIGVTFSLLNKWKKIAHFGTCLANISLLILLCLRWQTTGHYPLSNLYESLLFLTWSVVTLQLTLEGFVKIPVVGTITTPLALFLLGFALFSLPPDLRGSQPLVPALQSHWLLMHVTSMLISYAALLVGSLFAIALLVLVPDQEGQNDVSASINNSNRQFEISKNIRIKLPFFLQPFKSFWPGWEVSIAGPSLIADPDLYRDRSRKTPGRLSVAVQQQMHRQMQEDARYDAKNNEKCKVGDRNHQRLLEKDFSGKSKTNLEAVLTTPLAGESVFLNDQERLKLERQAKENLFSSLSFQNPSAVSTPAALNQLVERQKENLIDLSTKSSLKTTRLERLSQYGGKSSDNSSSVLFVSYNLDMLSYRTLGIGFAFLTVGLLSGAVWANEAWGSYWSWDPKETWALITWFIFAVYLHTRVTIGWSGKKPALMAVFGFVMVWVCYLGVNLLGKGLHSYGWITN